MARSERDGTASKRVPQVSQVSHKVSRRRGNPRRRIPDEDFLYVKQELGQGDFRQGIRKLDRYRDLDRHLAKVGNGDPEKGLETLLGIAKRQDAAGAMAHEAYTLLSAFIGYGDEGARVREGLANLPVVVRLVAGDAEAAKELRDLLNQWITNRGDFEIRLARRTKRP